MSAAQRPMGGGFFASVDALVSGFKNDLETAKAAAEEHGFSRRVQVVPPGLWKATRKDGGRKDAGVVVRGSSCAELVEAMKALDAGAEKTFSKRKKGG